MTQVLSKTPQPREISDRVNTMLRGGLNNTGQLTLSANVSTTTITDYNVNNESRVFLMPRTLNAAGAISTTYISDVSNNQFTVTHANTATTDRTFDYCIFG